MRRQRLVTVLLTLVMLALAVGGMIAINLNTRPLDPEPLRVQHLR